MITERTIINGLIMGASFIIVPFLITSTLSNNYWPIALLTGGCGLLMAFYFLGNRLSLFPALGGSVMGTLNFLPWPLNAISLFCLILIILKRKIKNITCFIIEYHSPLIA